MVVFDKGFWLFGKRWLINKNNLKKNMGEINKINFLKET